MKKYILSEQIELNDSDIDIDRYVSMPPAYAGAIEDMAKARKRRIEVDKQLKKTADDFLTGKKVKVEESRRSRVNEGKIVRRNRRINEAKAQIEDLDDDMWTFIYDLLANLGNRFHKPTGALGQKKGFDVSPDVTGFSEITTDYNGNIVLQADSEKAFDKAKELCDKYKIKYGNVTPIKGDKVSITVKVPKDKNGDPIMAKKYFKSIGIDIKDVR